MSERTHAPAGLLLGALAGVLTTTLCLMGAAAWMAKQGCSASMAWPLATASVCMGSFWAGGLAAFLRKAQGLLTGLVQGGLFAAALGGLTLAFGATVDAIALARMGAVLVCSCAGGLLGRTLGEKKRRI